MQRARSRSARRLLLALAASACAALALLQFAAAGSAGSASSNAAAGVPVQSTGLLAEGANLFRSSCAACHGSSAQGIRGRGPDLHGVGALAADFYLRTGRMPLPSPRAQPLRTRPAFAQPQIRALVAYVASLGGPGGPLLPPSRGS